MKKRFRLRITVGALLYAVFRSNHCSALVILMRLFNRFLLAVLVVLPFIGFAFLIWLLAKGQLDVPAGNPSETAIRVIRILGGVGVLLTRGFMIAGVMGLARAGPKGPFFFIEQAFYISTMGYPFLYLVCTMLSISLAERNSAVLALLAQAAPIAIPVVLFILSKGLDKVSVQKKKEEKEEEEKEDRAPKNIDVLFVAGFGPIVRDAAASRKFYSEALGLPFKEDTDGYLHTGGLDGVKHFALWPLAQAAESCFGTDQWPGNLPVPQAWIEFDIGNIEKATAELKSQGYKLLVATRKEPWGQVVTRLLGPEGLLVGITHTPSMRK